MSFYGFIQNINPYRRSHKLKQQPIHIFHFNNGSGGGVLSVIQNILKYRQHPEIVNHVIYTINKDFVKKFDVPRLTGAASEQVFYYSPKWNFYYTCRQLAKLLPNNKAVIVAHDWLELGMMSNLGLQNTVLQFVHGNYDYYYELANKHEQSIDRFITVSPVIHKNLAAMMAHRAKDIFYCRFPVPSVEPGNHENEILKLIYCVRRLDDVNKEFRMLPLINAALKQKGIHVNWTIVGDGMEKEAVEKLMGPDTAVTLFTALPNEELIKQLALQDLFILPSINEGFPVSVVEAMKAGVIPLTTDWKGATDELMIDAETGYYFKNGNVEGYASTIEILNKDRILLKEIALNGIKKANELFDPISNCLAIGSLIIQTDVASQKIKKSVKVYGSRLDQNWLPNFFTQTLRKFL